MSTSAALPFAFSQPSGAGLLALVERVFSLAPRERMTAQERALVEQARELSGTFGAYVLEAEDRGDLITRIDAVIGDPRFHAAQQDLWAVDDEELLAGLVGGLAGTSAVEEAPDAMAQVLGAASAPFLRELHSCLSETIRCMAHLLETMPPDAEISPALESFVGVGQEGDPLAFISSPEVPVPVAEALLSSMRLNALFLASVALLFKQGTAAPWLKLAISELLANSSKRGLALIAALSGAEVPVELLPMDERLELTGLEQHSKAVLAAYARFNMAAERSGEPVYPSAS